MIPIPLIVVAALLFAATAYFFVRSREFSKFLAGAFFTSSGVLVYLWIAQVSVPLLGTSFVQTPDIAGWRSIANFVFFCVTFYRGFLMKRRAPN